MLEVGKTLGCEYCSATFNSQETLNIHNRLHAQQSVMCVLCRAVFSTIGSMRVHLWKAHSINKSDQERSMVALNWAAESFVPDETKTLPPYKCYKCNKAFKYEFSIARHLRAHRKKEELLIGPVDVSHGETLQTRSDKATESNRDKSTCVGQDKSWPTHSGSNDSSSTITLSLSVEDQGPMEHPSTNIKILRPKTPAARDRATAANRKRKSSQLKYECGWCGASFKFDFSYEAHMRQHAMMDSTVDETRTS